MQFRVVAVSLMPQRIVVIFSAQWAFSIFERNTYTTLSCFHMQQCMVIPYITPVMEIKQVSKTLVCNRTLMWLISWETFSTRGNRFALSNLIEDIPLCYELKTLKQSVIFASNTTKFYSSMTTYIHTYLLSYLLAYLHSHSLHGAESFLRSWPLFS